MTYLNEELGEVDQKVLQDARRWKEAEQWTQLELWHEPGIEAEHHIYMCHSTKSTASYAAFDAGTWGSQQSQHDAAAYPTYL